MKKYFFIVLMFSLCILLTGCNEKDNSKDFLGKWGSGRATLDVVEENDKYIININWSSSAYEHLEWNYNCDYVQETNTMNCSGKKSNKVFDDDQHEQINVIYTDGKANFSLEDGNIIWNDEKENAGDGMKFTK